MCHKLVPIRGNKHINTLKNSGTTLIHDRCGQLHCISLNHLLSKSVKIMDALYIYRADKLLVNNGKFILLCIIPIMKLDPINTADNMKPTLISLT